MADAKTVSLYKFLQRLPNEEAARKFFEGKRWPNGIDCPHCGSVSVSECKNHRPMAYRCRDCRQHFSVRTGSVLGESRLPLQKWLMAIYMMTTARRGIPSTQVARELGITQKSAWFLCQRIRETWLARSGQGASDTGPLNGEVEAGEVYIGGKEKNKHRSRKLNADRGTVGKAPGVEIIERSRGCGSFRHMRVKHLDRHVGEFASRHNTADLSTLDFIGEAAKGMAGRAITL